MRCPVWPPPASRCRAPPTRSAATPRTTAGKSSTRYAHHGDEHCGALTDFLESAGNYPQAALLSPRRINWSAPGPDEADIRLTVLTMQGGHHAG
jgi:hypothetical protein